MDGTPWFVAADVCKALDLTNPTEALASMPPKLNRPGFRGGCLV
ncbi:BRO family protein [Pseudorhodoferax sp.]|nr:BRO family protein [Pseudorhodoferax sp.]